MKKRIFGILALGAVLFTTSNLNAANINDNDKVKTAKEYNDGAAVKYLGETADNGIVFDVNYSNPSGKSFNLVITNAQGDVLFEKAFTGSNFSRKVMIKKDPDVNGIVRFSVRNNNGVHFDKTYQMHTESELIRNVVVKAIN